MHKDSITGNEVIDYDFLGKKLYPPKKLKMTQAGKDYAKQARKDFNSNWMYNKLTGIDKPATDSSNALRVGQQFWDAKKKEWRIANWHDVQNAVKKGGQQFEEQAAQNAIKRNSRMMCGNIELPEPGH